MIKTYYLKLAGALGVLLAPLTAIAAPPQILITIPPKLPFDPCWIGVMCVNLNPVVQNMNDAMFIAAGFIAVCIFVIGAFMMVISADNDENLQRGKRAMKGAVIGMALITGSYGVFRAVTAILYGI